MFNKFYKWLGSKIAAAQQDKYQDKVASVSKMPNQLDRSFGEINPLDFRIHRATGGAVIECRNYDMVKDRSNVELYVIPDGDDFAERMASHIQMEYLKRA